MHGHVYVDKPTDTICSLLGISSADTDDIHCFLCLLTVRFLDTVTRTRRRIERTLTTFVLTPSISTINTIGARSTLAQPRIRESIVRPLAVSGLLVRNL